MEDIFSGFFLQKLRIGYPFGCRTIEKRPVISDRMFALLVLFIFTSCNPYGHQHEIRLDLSSKIDSGDFDPQNDRVWLAGSFNDWQAGQYRLMDAGGSDTVNPYAGDVLQLHLVFDGRQEDRHPLMHLGDGTFETAVRIPERVGEVEWRVLRNLDETLTGFELERIALSGSHIEYHLSENNE